MVTWHAGKLINYFFVFYFDCFKYLFIIINIFKLWFYDLIIRFSSTHKACGFESPGLDHLLYRLTLEEKNMDNYKD